MTITTTDSDTQTWTVTGFSTCDVNGCGQDAAIIADVCDYDRFCLEHTDIAALIPHHYLVFKGWYRIIASRYHPTGNRIIFTVHPL